MFNYSKLREYELKVKILRRSDKQMVKRQNRHDPITRFISGYPLDNLLHGNRPNLKLILLAMSHHLLVKFAGFFQGLNLVDGGIAQFL